MRKIIYGALIFLLACGGKSDPLLTATKMELNKKRIEGAYKKLSMGLYALEGKNKNLKTIPEAWFEMGKLHAGKEEYKKMHTAFSKVKELEANEKEKKYTKEAENFVKQSGYVNYNKAYKLYEKAFAMSDIAKKMKRIKKALAYIDKAIEFDKTMAGYFSLRADLKTSTKSDNGVESDYKKALSLEPNNYRVMESLGLYYFNKKKYDLATEKFNDVLQNDSIKSLRVIKFRSYSYQNSGQHKKAIESYKEWQKLDPQNKTIKEHFAPLYFQTKNYLKAIEVATQVINADPSCDKSQYVYLANSYFSLINELKEKRTNKKNNLKKLKSFAKECLALLEKAVKTETHKENGELWKYMSYLHAQLGNKKSARKAKKMAKKFGDE